MADDIRVVRLIPEGEEHTVTEGGLKETRMDGTEVGEIVMRGNLVMKVSAEGLISGHEADLSEVFEGVLERSESDNESFRRRLLPLGRPGCAPGRRYIRDSRSVQRHHHLGRRKHQLVVNRVDSGSTSGCA